MAKQRTCITITPVSAQKATGGKGVITPILSVHTFF